MRHVGVITVFFLFFFSFSSSTFAQESSGLTVNPIFQEIQLSEFQTSTSAGILIKNNTDTAQTVAVSNVDFQQVDAQGNIQLSDKPLTNENFSLAKYITFTDNSITLEPKQEQLITAQITNSLELSPGTHYGAVILRFTDSNTSLDSQVVPAISSIIILKKNGGEVYQMSLQSVSGLSKIISLKVPSNIELLFSNDGNTHDTPRGVVTITGLFGRLIKKGWINEGSFIALPNNRRNISVQLATISTALPIDFIQYQITGESQSGKVAYQSQGSFIYINPIPLLILVLLVGAFIWLRKKKQNEKK